MSWSSVGFEKMFVEMGTTLPTLTVFIMTPGFQMIVPVLAIAGLIKEIVIRNRLITFMINGIHICVLILLVVVWQLALFLPLIDLMEMMGEA